MTAKRLFTSVCRDLHAWNMRTRMVC